MKKLLEKLENQIEKMEKLQDELINRAGRTEKTIEISQQINELCKTIIEIKKTTVTKL